MAETRTLKTHDDIRSWASARAGKPAITWIPSGGTTGDRPVLQLVFGQRSINAEGQGPDRDQRDLVEWDEWFKVFDEGNMALVVAEEQPGRLDEFHEIVTQ